MANKPKGSYKDYLELSSEDIKNLSDGELRGIVNKLNDAANKRARRLKQAGFESSSPALREREGKGFNISRKADKADLKSAYADARNFLSGKTGSLAGTRGYLKQFDPLKEKVIARAMENPENLDKRYKTPRLKKSAEKKAMTDFWDEYDKYREIEKNKNPNKGDDYTTNLEDVSEFYEELYEEGETDLEDYEEKAEEDYLEDEGDYYDEGEEEDGSVQPPQPKRGGKGGSKQVQHKASGAKPKYGKTKSTSGIRQRFEKIKIF